MAEESLQKANEELEKANISMQRDLAEAAQIQRAWLPQSLPQVDGYHFAWSFIPCQELGGDSLNVIRLDENHVGMYVFDVTGHGVGAALLSASVQRWLSPVPEHSCLFDKIPGSENNYGISSPAAVATKLNSWFQAEPKQGKFFTLIYGVLDLRDGELRYTTAGHPPPLMVGPDGSKDCPLAKGIPIGMLKEFDFGEARLKLQPGDRLLFFTDGAEEAADENDQMYEMDRLIRDMERYKDHSPDEALGSIMGNLRQWSGTEAMEDDVTFLLIDAKVAKPPGS